jgi:hypothetical protein
MDALMRQNLVCRRGSFYPIQDDLFGFWLNKVYRRRRDTFSSDIAEQLRDFREDLRALWDDFWRHQTMDRTERLLELFRSFENDVVELQGRRRSLPHFMQVQVTHEDDTASVIEAEASHRRWVCCVRKAFSEEHDVLWFADYCRTRRSPIHRQIFVALKGLDDTARLLAKARNMWIWEIQDVNMLMRLYGKHAILP